MASNPQQQNNRQHQVAYANVSPNSSRQNSNGIIMTPVSTAGSVQGPTNVYPLGKRNYTYTAHVAVPNTQPQHNFLKLPRVLPPPNSHYTTSPILQQRRESFIPLSENSTSPLATIQSKSPTLPSFQTLEDNRRHSISLATLNDPIHNHNIMGQASILQAPHRLSLPIIKSENDVVLPPQENDINELYVNGEKYNQYGQLIGRSGKVLRDTKRAAQNRCAQKAFRIRREKYIKNLELKSKKFADIVTENTRLRSIIEEFEKRVSK